MPEQPEHSAPGHQKKVQGLYATAQDFMERCAERGCAVALGELAVANGFMQSRSARYDHISKSHTVRPRLIVVTGFDPLEQYSFDVATFSTESLTSPLLRMAHLLPNEAHYIRQQGIPFKPLSKHTISKLTYDIETARPTGITEEHARHFYGRMLKHFMPD